MKVLIFDSGTLINLSMNGLLYILEELKKKFDGKFVITPAVKYEVIDRPVGIERFELGALQIKDLLEKKVIEMSNSVGVEDSVVKQETAKMMEKANHFLKVKGQWISIVSEAETSCLALSQQLTNRKVDNLIAIDERTTRVLCENPSDLERVMSEKLHQRVELTNQDFSDFSKFKFIRSSELVFVAYKKGVIRLSGSKVLEALLYATKFKGSSISFEEINEIKRM